MRTRLFVFAAIGLVAGATLGISAPAAAATVTTARAATPIVSDGDHGHWPPATSGPTPSPQPTSAPAPEHSWKPKPTPTPRPTATSTPPPTHSDPQRDHHGDCSAPSHPTPPPLQTPVWSFDLVGMDANDIHPGATLTISGSGLPTGTRVDTVLHSVPVDLGSLVLGSAGTFTQSVVIPADTGLGAHELIVTASGTSINTTTLTKAITVTAVPTDVAPLPAPAPQPARVGTPLVHEPLPAGSALALTGSPPVSAEVPATIPAVPATPRKRVPTEPESTFDANILTRALAPIVDVAEHPQKIISAVEIGLVLLILAVLPAHLLSATIAEQSVRFERQLSRVRRRPHWLDRWAAWLKTRPVVGGVAVTAATAVVLGFADPAFGFTIASVRLILACGLGLLLVGYIANALAGWIARRRWHIIAEIRLRPYGLILTIAGVVLSRILHFSPGFLVGLILGLTVQGVAAKGFAGRLVALRASIVLTMGIAAWIGYSTLTIGTAEGGTFGSALLVETLVAITTEGIVALLVELLPLRFLEGERLYAHSKPLWAILYFLTLVMFVLAVVPWEGNWDALGKSLWIWTAILALFCAICIGVYIYFRRFAKPLDDEAGSEEVPIAEQVSAKE